MQPAPSTAKIYTLSLLTFGWYFLYWCSKSRAAVNAAARQQLVPPTWYLVIPGLNFLWVWQYANALEIVSFQRIKAIDTFSYYLIATGVFFLIPGSFHVSRSDVGPTTHTLVIIAIIVAVIAVEFFALGLGFFCDRIQKKINAVTPNNPA
jgi:hypothetical protein